MTDKQKQEFIPEQMHKIVDRLRTNKPTAQILENALELIYVMTGNESFSNACVKEMIRRYNANYDEVHV